MILICRRGGGPGAAYKVWPLLSQEAVEGENKFYFPTRSTRLAIASWVSSSKGTFRSIGSITMLSKAFVTC